MSTEPNAANKPPRTNPAAGSKSPLKLIIPLGVLVAVVFAVTYITQYTP